MPLDTSWLICCAQPYPASFDNFCASGQNNTQKHPHPLLQNLWLSDQKGDFADEIKLGT